MSVSPPGLPTCQWPAILTHTRTRRALSRPLTTPGPKVSAKSLPVHTVCAFAPAARTSSTMKSSIWLWTRSNSSNWGLGTRYFTKFTSILSYCWALCCWSQVAHFTTWLQKTVLSTVTTSWGSWLSTWRYLQSKPSSEPLCCMQWHLLCCSSLVCLSRNWLTSGSTNFSKAQSTPRSTQCCCRTCPKKPTNSKFQTGLKKFSTNDQFRCISFTTQMSC